MLTGFGFAVWVLGSVGCAVAPKFWVLILCRVIMGAGEASIITLGNPFIDDVAPPAQKTLWFGILNLVSSLTLSHSSYLTPKPSLGSHAVPSDHGDWGGLQPFPLATQSLMMWPTLLRRHSGSCLRNSLQNA